MKKVTNVYFDGDELVIERESNGIRNYSTAYAFGEIVKPPTDFVPGQEPTAMTWTQKPTSTASGQKITFKWSGGTSPFNVTLKQLPDGAPQTKLVTVNSVEYTLDNTTSANVSYSLSVVDAQDFKLEAEFAVTPLKSVSGKTIASANGGDFITFANLFTTVNTTAADFNFAVNPTAAGTVGADGSLTLADNASGKVTVTATAKASGVVGSPATATITAVTAKPSISGKTIASATGGDVIQFDSLFIVTNITANDFNYVVNPTDAGTITAAGVLTLANNASGKVTVVATAKTGTVTGSPATATITAVTPKKSIAGKTIASATGGDVIAFTALYTAENVVAGDFTYAVNPASAGTVDGAGALTLADNASGKVTVVATAKAAGVSGSPATATITAVTPKKTITAKTIASANGGDVIPFANMFTVANVTAADFDYAVTPTEAGSVNTTSGDLTLADTASGEVKIVATAKSAAGAVTGSPATATITTVTPKP